MDPARFLEINALAWTGLLVLTLLSMVGAIVIGVGMLTSSRVRPVFAGLALGPLAIAPPVVAAASSAFADPAEAVLRATGVLLVAPIFAWPVAATGLLLFAGAGALGSPRRIGPALGFGAAALLLTLVPVVGLFQVDGLFEFAIVRAASYAALGLLFAPSTLAGDPEGRASLEAGAASALALCAYVALAEAGVHGVIGYFLIGALAVVPAAARDDVIAAIHQSHVVPSIFVGVVAVAIAGTIALVAIGRAARARRHAASWVGAVWVAIALAGLWLAAPSQAAWSAFAATLPEPPIDGADAPASPVP